ncbi:MAG TPA: DUF1549 and DUF1553 domain-containing protein [Bryobacteraceae bacterium]|nr:DUF1549 and DUF1553 domain-containing protein [Bryobacteraceae bacterium]
MRLAAAIPLLVALAFGAEEFRGDTDKDRARILARKTWWSFQPLRKVTPPGPGHPIDAFMPAASTGAYGSRLVRRLALDVTGLPPTPEQVKQFLADRRLGAYERLVDRLLSSSAYGERWAQRWLDLVRYADTNGFELDVTRTHAWRYRDYVVRSFNADKPFDRFLKEQVAGDEIWPGDKDALVALGFHRAGPEHLVGGNQDEELNRQEVLTEMTAGISNVLLGLTMNCARCHNHKFDPILQSDYYRLQAVFGGTEGKEIPIADAAEAAAYETAKKAHAARVKPIEDAIKAIEKPYRDRLISEKKAALPAELRALLDADPEKLTAEQKIERKDAREQSTPSWDEVLAVLAPADRERRAALRKQLHAVNLDEPQPAAAAYAVVSAKPHDTHVLKVGDHRMKLGTVSPGVPVVLSAALPAQIPTEATGRRRALAEWLADPAHPLTPRVMVNRIWQFRMGKGIVATPNDFGTLGERPTQPDLLDWLAGEFIGSGWSVKHIDRLILTSAAYRQSKPLHRRRLEGEAIRDSVLAVSGLLNTKSGGPPIRVPIEPEVYDLIFTEYEADNLWPLPKDRSDIYRRYLYLFNKRTVRLPLLANFDQPDAMTSCAVRSVSTHALQSLSLLNSDFMSEQAAAFAQRLSRDARTRTAQVDRAYRLALARRPAAAEMQLARRFFQSGGNLEDFCLALLNRTEFLYIP